MKIKEQENDIILENIECFDVELSLFCGQAFRWEKNEDGSFTGTVRGKVLNISQNGSSVILKNTTKEDFQNIWLDYFDLERDYADICKRFEDDIYLKKARDEYYGIRVLNQEPWEALCSFIISQNNNIPRISGIIKRLCESFGEKIDENNYSFPSYERLKNVSTEDLGVLRAGFRAKYIADAVQKLNSEEISLEEIKEMPIEQARQELMKIKGVGAKVAECTLLYGFGRKEAFPVDVWVKRIMAELYPDGLPLCIKDVEGIAQQYLFHWRRNVKEN
ncbi:MAG: DNA-3-methyladenine glycosylase 2 family protein [Ruminococcaceae bacterium]|nr:DNA-3-methyladenine glycosylase 2 family protein [Oscillospiraceae bacterium]